MFQLKMILTRKKQRQIVENFVINWNMYNVSWPTTKYKNTHKDVLTRTWNNTKKYIYNMHLLFLWTGLIQYQTDQGLQQACTWKRKQFYTDLHHEWKNSQKKFEQLWRNGPRRHLTRNMGKGQKDNSPSSEGWTEP